jgi:peptidoglycan/LPS O-acetylase OafA/YrhL
LQLKIPVVVARHGLLDVRASGIPDVAGELHVGLIRLYLAIVVMAAHGSLQLFRPHGIDFDEKIFGMGGASAVMFFYMVSGFLISFVLAEKYPSNVEGASRFYRSRFLRIYPLWWTMVAITWLWHWPGWMHAEPVTHVIAVIGLFGSDYIQAFSHYPQITGIFPGQISPGWSLGVEVAFYALAPFLLRSWKLSLATFVGSAAMRILVVEHIGIREPGYFSWNNYSLPAALTFFCAGDLARRFWKVVPIKPTVGALLLLPSFYFQTKMDGRFADSEMLWIAAALFALALPPVFALTKDNCVMNFCGDLTYPLYITHCFLIVSLKMYGLDAPLFALGGYGLIAFGALAIAVALACHLLVERPIIAAFDWLLKIVTWLSTAHGRNLRGTFAFKASGVAAARATTQ